METLRHRVARLWAYLVREQPWLFVAVGFAAVSVVWIALDQLPPPWDQAWYLEGSVHLHNALTRGGLPGLATEFTVVNGYKPPLLSLLAVPFYLAFGHSYDVALWVNVALTVVGSYFVFRLTRRLSSSRAGVYAVVVFNLFPMIVGLSREFFVESLLATTVAAWHVYLIESDDLKAERSWRPLGIALGLGMLTKILFPLYIIGGAAYVLWRRIRSDRGITRQLWSIVWRTFALGFAISATWYTLNIRAAFRTAFGSGFGNTASNYGSRDVFAWETLSAYWWEVSADVVSLSLALLLVVVFVGLLVARWRGKLVGPAIARSDARNVLIWWIAVPFVVLTVGVNKDIRFMVPVLPALAVLGGAGIGAMAEMSRPLRWALNSAVAVAVGLSLMGSFLPAKTVASTSRVVRAALLTHDRGQLRAPRADHWPIEELGQAVEADAIERGIAEPTVALLLDHTRINHRTMDYLRVYRGWRGRYRTSDDFSRLTDSTGVPVVVENADYFVVKTGDIGPDFSNILNRIVVAELIEGKLPYEEIWATEAPDGTTLTLYRKAR